MPTYEYECTRCGAVVELFQSITEPARRKLRKNDPKACDCGVGVRRRIGTGAGLIFKGSGFYLTDYRSESYKKAAKAESEAAGGKSGDNGKAASGDSASKSDASTTPKSDSSGKDKKPSGDGRGTSKKS